MVVEVVVEDLKPESGCVGRSCGVDAMLGNPKPDLLGKTPTTKTGRVAPENVERDQENL